MPRRFSPITTLKPNDTSPPLTNPKLPTIIPRQKCLQSNCRPPRYHSRRNAPRLHPPSSPKPSSDPPSNSHPNPYLRAVRRRSSKRVNHPPSPPGHQQTLSPGNGRHSPLITPRDSECSRMCETTSQRPFRLHHFVNKLAKAKFQAPLQAYFSVASLIVIPKSPSDRNRLPSIPIGVSYGGFVARLLADRLSNDRQFLFYLRPLQRAVAAKKT